jgi:hypothetical protein
MPSTPTEALLDVNVVIASVFADHTMHGAGTIPHGTHDARWFPAFRHAPVEE